MLYLSQIMIANQDVTDFDADILYVDGAFVVYPEAP